MSDLERIGIGLIIMAVIQLGATTMIKRGKENLDRRSMITLIPLSAGTLICSNVACYFLFHWYLPIAYMFTAIHAAVGVMQIIYFVHEWVREGRMACVPK